VSSLRSINGNNDFSFSPYSIWATKVCVCIRNAKGCCRRRRKSLSSRRGKMKQGFSLSLFKSHTRPLIFMFFFSFFCSGLSHKSGRNGPSSFWVSDRSFFSSFLNSLWCRTEQTSLLYSFLFFFSLAFWKEKEEGFNQPNL
jgi:hypothetical protein